MFLGLLLFAGSVRAKHGCMQPAAQGPIIPPADGKVGDRQGDPNACPHAGQPGQYRSGGSTVLWNVGWPGDSARGCALRLEQRGEATADVLQACLHPEAMRVNSAVLGTHVLIKVNILLIAEHISL
jgi:hypothetical protein